MRILVVGAGIAGLTLAGALRRRWNDVTLIERAPRLRDQGYMIDFFGSGFDVAERLGLLTELNTINYPIERLVFVDSDGRERFALPYPKLRKTLFRDRCFNFMRSELEALLYRYFGGEGTVRFGSTVAKLEQDSSSVRVTFGDGTVDVYDLVVGADGLHSSVRALAFGEEKQFIRYLGYHTAAYVIADAELRRQVKGTFQTLTVPGRQVAIYPIRGGRVATFFVHRSAEDRVERSIEAARRELIEVYGDLSWVVPRLLDHLPHLDDIYYDTVSQIEVPRWSQGRVTLLGDACQCPSLLAGQGASMAMGGAYILAEELATARNLETALQRYEERVRPAIDRKQLAGRRIARWFVPEKGWLIALRDFSMRLSAWPVTSYVVRSRLSGDSIIPPDRAARS